ncbi:hypothetical protein C8R43DRAFT_1121446 [Mycena crocata]|nr:hypothetical protein C8R43DRAFT_1121446 [Mycena crocata]
MTQMGKRAVTNSAQAKQAAAIAAAEAQMDEKQKPVKKRGCPKGSKNKSVAVPEPSMEPQEPEEDIDQLLPEDKDIVIDWTHTLVWTLVTAIESSEIIHDSLFPGVGAIKQNGSVPKTHHYYSLVNICFAEHPEYKDVFAIKPDMSTALQATQRKMWTHKIKNKLKTLITKARENITEMGQTSAGIGSEDEILPGTPFTTKWELMKADSPWFFNIQALIVARPNLQPVGLGNQDDFDVNLLVPTGDGVDTSSAPDDTPDLPSQLTGSSMDISSDSEDELLDTPTLSNSTKHVWEEDAPPPQPVKKKTKPQPAVSTPATPVVPAKKAMSTKDKFSATILAEEETAQRTLRVKQEKTEARKEVALAKIRMESESCQRDSESHAAREESKRQSRAAKMDWPQLLLQFWEQLILAL